MKPILARVSNVVDEFCCGVNLILQPSSDSKFNTSSWQQSSNATTRRHRCSLVTKYSQTADPKVLSGFLIKPPLL